MRRVSPRWMQPSIDRKTSGEKALIRSTLVHANYSEEEAFRLADKPGFTQFDADLIALCQERRAG